MRAVIIALGCLATTFSLPTLASGQNQIADAKAATRIFWNQLYSQGGTSLYCGQTFAGESGQLKVSPVYSSKQLKSALRCITNRQCSIMTPTYPYMTADLHNLYPASKRPHCNGSPSVNGWPSHPVPRSMPGPRRSCPPPSRRS
jgi:deoxyribonuclease-1